MPIHNTDFHQTPAFVQQVHHQPNAFNPITSYYTNQANDMQFPNPNAYNLATLNSNMTGSNPAASTTATSTNPYISSYSSLLEKSQSTNSVLANYRHTAAAAAAAAAVWSSFAAASDNPYVNNSAHARLSSSSQTSSSSSSTSSTSSSSSVYSQLWNHRQAQVNPCDAKSTHSNNSNNNATTYTNLENGIKSNLLQQNASQYKDPNGGLMPDYTTIPSWFLI
jgi:hypothetical protein